REHRDAHRSLLGIDDARQPRVAAPRPPQHREAEQRLDESRPPQRRRDQRGALRQREHEDEVEEELEGRDALLLAAYRRQPSRPRLCRLHGHDPRTAGRRRLSSPGRVPYRFVESPNKTETSGRTFDVVVMHTMEIAERPDAAMICARWFASTRSTVRAHSRGA